MSLSFDSTNELLTIRDWWRYAVSRFTAAHLTYGHGTETPTDEAAFLILHTLSLPIDRLDPFLDARLLMAERESLRNIIDRRIQSRRPAAYLTRTAYIQDHAFYVDERVIVPRSYIGELLATDGLAGAVAEPERVGSVLDLCTGSGCLAILAALAFPDAMIDASDISADALVVARRNVADYGLAGRITLHQGDLFAPFAEHRWDLIIANPPYVATPALESFPPEYRAEPVIAHAGGIDGMDLVRRILAAAEQHLNPGGHLVMEIGRGRPVVVKDFPGLPFQWLDTAGSSGEVLAIAADALRTKPAAVAAPPAPKRTKRAAKA